MESFASRYMKSKGWAAGDGLGKALQGRKDPVKVKYKFDINGLGHDKAEEDKYKWWEYAFKTAADAIQVGKDNKVERVEGKTGPVVSTSRPLNKALNRALLYGSHFVRKGVLEGGKFKIDAPDDSDSDSSSDDDVAQMRTKGKIVDISDEALFAACGGMTGHKGARHGINMTAKLSRIKEQERIGLQAMKDRLEKSKSPDSGVDSPKQANDDPTQASVEIERETKVPKKKKKSKKAKESEKIDEVPEKKQKKKKRRQTQETEEENIESVEKHDVLQTPKKSKKKKDKEELPEVMDLEPEIESLSEKKKKKKKKRRAEDSIEVPATEESPVEEAKPKKKKKKKSKTDCTE